MSASSLHFRTWAKRRRAFTLTELLTLSATLALLSLLLAPALAGTRPSGQATRCVNNLRQLGAAWRMYADDNNGRLVYNRAGTGMSAGNEAWVAGFLDFSSSSYNTNVGFLVDHARYPYAAFLGPYVKSASVFRCPADRSTILQGTTRLPRCRSLSMNNSVGEGAQPWGGSSGATQVYRKLDAIATPPPASLFVILDEHEDSINDGIFVTTDTPWTLVDYPASYHNRAAGFVFADGHCEIHRWTDPRTAPVLGPGQMLPFNTPMPSNVDVAWLQQHATSRP